MRYTDLSLSQTPPRMSSTFLQQPQLVTTMRQGGSREPAPESPASATVTESQVTQPSELTSLLQQLVTQQREDRLAQEEAKRAHEAQLAAIQRRPPKSVLQPRSVLSGSLTEFHRGQTLSSS